MKVAFEKIAEGLTMSKAAFEKIADGLNEALAISRGQVEPAQRRPLPEHFTLYEVLYEDRDGNEFTDAWVGAENAKNMALSKIEEGKVVYVHVRKHGDDRPFFFWKEK